MFITPFSIAFLSIVVLCVGAMVFLWIQREKNLDRTAMLLMLAVVALVNLSYVVRASVPWSWVARLGLLEGFYLPGYGLAGVLTLWGLGGRPQGWERRLFFVCLGALGVAVTVNVLESSGAPVFFDEAFHQYRLGFLVERIALPYSLAAVANLSFLVFAICRFRQGGEVFFLGLALMHGGAALSCGLFVASSLGLAFPGLVKGFALMAAPVILLYILTPLLFHPGYRRSAVLTTLLLPLWLVVFFTTLFAPQLNRLLVRDSLHGMGGSKWVEIEAPRGDGKGPALSYRIHTEGDGSRGGRDMFLIHRIHVQGKWLEAAIPYLEFRSFLNREARPFGIAMLLVFLAFLGGLGWNFQWKIIRPLREMVRTRDPGTHGGAGPPEFEFIRKALMENLAQHGAQELKAPDFAEDLEAKCRAAGLTGREEQILPDVLLGKKTREIAQVYSMSENTVKTHVKSIYGKFAVHSKVELVNLLSGLKQGVKPDRKNPLEG